MAGNLKTVNLKPETKARLASLVSKDQTYDEAVQVLLNKAETNKRMEVSA